MTFQISEYDVRVVIGLSHHCCQRVTFVVSAFCLLISDINGVERLVERYMGILNIRSPIFNPSHSTDFYPIQPAYLAFFWLAKYSDFMGPNLPTASQFWTRVELSPPTTQKKKKSL